jgi:hypothetical protein
MTSLEELTIYDAPLEGHGISLLTRLPHLHSLKLMFCKVTNEGIEGVSGLKHLKTLWVYSKNLTASSLPSFEGLKGLRSLALMRNASLTKEVMDTLRKKLRDTEVKP